MDEIKIQLKDGEVILRKPKAKHFSKALEEAEISNGEVKITKLLNILLPYCISNHPWGMTPINEAVGNLDLDEYSLLLNELKSFINVKGDVQGK